MLTAVTYGVHQYMRDKVEMGMNLIVTPYRFESFGEADTRVRC